MPELRVQLDADEKTLTIEDNGPGVPEDRAERVFAPFMTTKPVGQGRGLGLYISRDLAQYHKWKLHLDEEAGRVRADRKSVGVGKRVSVRVCLGGRRLIKQKPQTLTMSNCSVLN